MARTGTRGWKGCAMCKWHKDRRFGDPDRMGPKNLRKLGGKLKRVKRSEISRDDQQEDF